MDHITSSFIQVWQQPVDEQDNALLIIDNTGVHNYGFTHPKLDAFIKEIETRFVSARRKGNLRPNLDEGTICEFARRLLGPERYDDENIAVQIFEILD